MPITPVWGIYYRDTSSPASLETESALQANSVEEALTLVEDHVDTLGRGWESFTPVWSNLNMGNGSQDCAYTVIGNLVYAKYYLSFGTTTSITGTLSVPVPTTTQGGAAASATFGTGTFVIGSTTYPLAVIRFNNANVALRAYNSSGTYASIMPVTATVPAAATSGSTLQFNVLYRDPTL